MFLRHGQLIVGWEIDGNYQVSQSLGSTATYFIEYFDRMKLPNEQ